MSQTFDWSITIIIIVLFVILTLFFSFIFYLIINYKFKQKIKKDEIKSEKLLNKNNAENKLQWQIKKNEIEEKNKLNNQIIKKQKKWLFEKEKELDQYDKKLKNKLEIINSKEEKLDIEYKNLNLERKKLISKLETTANLSTKEAENELIKNVEIKLVQKLNKITKEKKNEIDKNIKEIISKTIANSIERYASEFVTTNTITKLELKDENFKGKIIGKEGRNIKKFEEISGVDIILEDDSNVVKLSCFNPIRREVAFKALKRLINDGRIQPQRIKDFLIEESKKIDDFIREAGLKTVNELKIIDLAPELVFAIGKLKYRTSYGQSVLQHSIEVAKIAGSLASELKLDDKLAIRAGLLHDIGKAFDYEVNQSHVEIGVSIAQKYQENDIVINAIHSHHGDVPTNNIYSLLVSAADTISAARPGARDNVHEDYLRRMKIIEEFCNGIKGVKKCYAVKSGRVIMVFVDPLLINDYELDKVIEKIEINLKAKLKIPGDVLIKVMREMVIEKTI